MDEMDAIAKITVQDQEKVAMVAVDLDPLKDATTTVKTTEARDEDETEATTTDTDTTTEIVIGITTETAEEVEHIISAPSPHKIDLHLTTIPFPRDLVMTRDRRNINDAVRPLRDAVPMIPNANRKNQEIKWMR